VPLPFAPPLTLSDEQAQELQALARAHSTPQALAFRCRLILRAAGPDRPANGQVAQECGCHRHTVALWRGRFREDGLAGLQDAPRPGRPRRVPPRRTP
jgi:Winged helix-turn helix